MRSAIPRSIRSSLRKEYTLGNYLDSNGLSYFWSKLKTMFQPKLVSGTNIKTVNNESLLGSGNIAISGGVTVDSALSSTSTNPVENQAIADALDGKSDTGHTHAASDVTSGTLDAARIPSLAASKITSGVLDPARALGWLTNNASALTDTVIPISTSRYTSGANTGWSVVNLRSNLQLCFGTVTANVVVNTAYHNMYRNAADLHLRLPAFVGEPTRILAALSTIQGGSAGMDAFMQFGGTRPGNWYTESGSSQLTNYDVPFRIVASHAYGSSNVRFYFSVLLLVYTT